MRDQDAAANADAKANTNAGAYATGASARRGSTSRRGPGPLGVGGSGGVDRAHADGARQGLYSLATAHAVAGQSARR